MKRKWLIIGIIVCVLLVPEFVKGMLGSPAIELNVEHAAPRITKACILPWGNLAYEEEARLSPEVIGKVTTLSMLGGLVGLFLGAGLAMIASKMIPNFPTPEMPWWSELLAFGFSSLVGLVFGIVARGKSGQSEFDRIAEI